MSRAATFFAPTSVSIILIARAAASAPLSPSRKGSSSVRGRSRARRTEAVLVGHVLRRERHRQVGASVVGVVEDDDGLATGGEASDLDGVLDRFGAGVEEREVLACEPGVRAASSSHTST